MSRERYLLANQRSESAWYFGEGAEGEVIGIGEVRGMRGARPTPEIKIEGTFLGPDKAPVGTDSAYVFGRARRLVSSRVIDDTTLQPANAAAS